MKFENVVCGIEEFKNLEEMTVDELTSFLDAHEQRSIMKEQKTFTEALQVKATISDDKLLLNQQERGRERSRGSHRFNRGRGCEQEENEFKKDGQSIQQNWRGYGRSHNRGGRIFRSRGSRPVECYNYGKFRHFAKDFWSDNRVEESLILDEKADTEEDRILLMA